MLFVVCFCSFKVIFFEKFFHENHQSAKQFGSRSLSANYLQRLSAADTSTHIVKVGVVYRKVNCTY